MPKPHMANVQFVEVEVTVRPDGSVTYGDKKHVTVTERLALIVYRLKPEVEGRKVRFASTPFVWVDGDRQNLPTAAPAAVQVTRESDDVATVFDTNVSAGTMHLLPVIHNGNAYVVPTDPSIINRDDTPGPG